MPIYLYKVRGLLVAGSRCASLQNFGVYGVWMGDGLWSGYPIDFYDC